MKKILKGTAVILSLVMILGTCACGDNKEEVVYPSDSIESQSKTESGDTDNETISSDGRVSYNVANSKGAIVFRVDADVVSEDKDFSVVEVGMTPSLDEHNSFNTLIMNLYDKDTVKEIIPPELAEPEYIQDRINILEKRAAEYSEDDIPFALSTELDILKGTEEISSKSTGRYTIPSHETPTVINLGEFYDSVGYDCEPSFCFVEGEIDGELYRTDYINYKGCWTVRIYKPRYAYGMGDRKYINGSELADGEQAEGISFSVENAKEKADVFLGKIYGLFESNFAGCYPVDIYGNLNTTGEHTCDRTGYVLFTNNMPRTAERPVTMYTDYYCDNACSTNPLLIAPHIASLHIIDVCDYCGSTFENISVTVDENGVDEVLICNLMGLMSVKSSRATLLPFEDINEIAQKELSLLADQYTNGINSFDIDRIELGMIKVESDGHKYLVPAWYFFRKAGEQQSLPEPMLCLNAIDGSAIDIANGGLTTTLDLK